MIEVPLHQYRHPLELFRSVSIGQSTRWASRVSLTRNFEGYVAKFAPHKALKWGLREAS